MSADPHSDYTRAAAICVNLALDGVEHEVRKELQRAEGPSAEALVRILESLKKRRIDARSLSPVGSA
jgi:hypothetical protein